MSQKEMITPYIYKKGNFINMNEIGEAGIHGKNTKENA